MEKDLPQACAPDGHVSGFKFNQFGVRVPAVLISPRVSNKRIDIPFDHTSLLKYVEKKWNLKPLGKRDQIANDFSDSLLELEKPRTDTPSPIDLTHFDKGLPNDLDHLNEHQHSLISFSLLLEEEIKAFESLERVGQRALKLLEGPMSQIEVAGERFLRFFIHKQASK
jgi:phospholipase C